MAECDGHPGVLVTGCSSGFGALIARTMGLAGYRVFATMRDVNGRNARPARELRDWAAANGVAGEILELDVDQPDSVETAVRTILDAGATLDVVVNNAAVTAFGPAEAYDYEQLFQVYNTNLFGPWRVDKAVLPHMRGRGTGLIVHVTSVVGRILRSGSLYAASKWAAEGLAETIAHDVRPFGIDVVLLEPGAYPTAWVGRGVTPANAEIAAEYAARASTALPAVDPGPGYRAPDPQEIADEVLRLARLPQGHRPLRTVVGHVYTEGIAAYNEAYEATREGLLRSFERADQAMPWLRP